MSSQHTIIIVGSGIAGPTLALTILSHPLLTNYRPLLLDRLPSSSATTGAAVVLSSNALYPLTNLDIQPALWAASAPSLASTIWRAHKSPNLPGRYLNSLKHPNWDPALDTSLRAIERGHLMKLLVDAVLARGGSVEWGVKAVGAEQTPTGVEVVLEDGTRHSGALVVGADGGWSTVRKALVGEGWKPEFSGASVLYGISRRPEGEDEEVLGKGHVVLLDVGGVGTWALPGGRQWWSVSLPEKEVPSGQSEVVESAEYGQVTTGGYSLESTEEVLRRLEKVWFPGVGECGAFFRNSEKIVRAPLWQRVYKEGEVANAVGEGNMVLVGDAGRIMLPTSGQGACMAIEDATVLANALLNNPPTISPSGKPCFSAALAEYTAARVPRSTAIAKQAYWSGIAFMAERWWWRWIRDFVVAWIPMDKDPKETLARGEKVRDPNEWLYSVKFEVKLREVASEGL